VTVDVPELLSDRSKMSWCRAAPYFTLPYLECGQAVKRWGHIS